MVLSPGLRAELGCGRGDAICVVNAKNETQERIGWVDSAFITKIRNLDDFKHTGNILEEKKWKEV